MKWIDARYINWKVVFNGRTYSEKYINKQYDMSISQEDYTWEVII